MPMLHPFDPASNKPRPNADGSVSTEISRTVQFPDGRWGNVPSLWWSEGGNYKDFGQMDDDQLAEFAMRYEQQSGQQFPRFGDLSQAEVAARQRSEGGGGMQGQMSQVAGPDLAKIKRNVAKMASMNAPEADIDGYIASEGVTVEDVRNFKAAQGQTPEVAQQAPSPGPLDFASQAMSGVNEGIANTLGFPVDAASMLLNLGSTGINKLTGAQLPQIESPVGGSGTFRQMLSPTIREESADPALQATRRVGQEVGAWAVPGAGMAAKTAKPLMTMAKELPSAVGSGLGAATAQQIAPDNPLFEFAGQMVGGMTPGGAARLVKGKPKIGKGSVDQLRAAKDAAYKVTDNLGVAYTPQAYDNVLVGIANEIKAAKINPDRHKAAYSVMQDLVKQRGKPMTLTELDQWRQIIRRDLITPSYTNKEMAADAEFGQMMIDKIDEFIGSAAGKDLVSGDADKAATAILTARELNTRYRKAEILADALYKAQLKTAGTGSGGNINNAIKQQITSILTNPKKVKSFSQAERQAMEALVRSGKIENLLRVIGKLSPSGNGLMAALGIGGVAMNPALAAAPLAGMAAKSVADGATLSKAAQLQDMIASGKVRPLPRPMPVPPSVLAAQGINQMGNHPLEITVRGGR